MVTCQSKNIWVNKAWNDIFEKKTSHINLIWYHTVTIVYQIYYFIGSVIDMISCIVYDFSYPHFRAHNHRESLSTMSIF